VEEYVFDIDRDARLLRQGEQSADRLPRPAVADVDGDRVSVRYPGDIRGPGDGEKILSPQLVCGFDHELGQFHAARPPRGVVIGERVWPVKEGTEAADGYSDLFGHFANGTKLSRPRFGREVILQVVVQLDRIEAGIPGELQAIGQRHPAGVGEGP